MIPKYKGVYMRVPNIIKSQISVNGFMCWGSRNFIGSDNLEDSKGYRFENGLGYLQFTVSNNPKIQQTVQVKIILWFNDTYTLKIFTKKRMTDKVRREWVSNGIEPDLVDVIETRNGVYCDQLEEVIFSILG